MKIVYSFVDHNNFKILKRKSKIMIKSLKILKMPLFLGFLKNPFNVIFNNAALEELNKDKLNYIWINEYKKWLIDQVKIISEKLQKRGRNRSFRMEMKDGKIIMEDNGVGEYFQNIELNKIKKKLKQKVPEIDESIMIKEWQIIQDDWMKHLMIIEKILDIIKRGLKLFRIYTENITNIKDEILLGNIVV